VSRSLGGTPFRGVFRRCLTARTIILCAIVGLVFTALTDLGIRWLCPPSTSPLKWALPSHSVINVSVPVGEDRFPALEFRGHWADHLTVWSGRVPDPGEMFAGPERKQLPRWSSLESLSFWRRDPELAYEGSTLGLPFRSSSRETVSSDFTSPKAIAAAGIGVVGIDPIYITTDARGFRTKSTRIFTLGVLANTVAWSCVAFGAWTAVTWWRVRRRHRRGVCEHCGYDLRGLVKPAADSGGSAKCPECGNAGPVRG
jgi:hypothetical protein